MDDLYDFGPATAPAVAAGPSAPAAGPSVAAADDTDLYGGLEAAPQLPSAFELRRQLAPAVAEREALEARLGALTAEHVQGREEIKDLTRRACVLLATARLELRRKETMLQEARAQPHDRREAAKRPRRQEG